MITKPTQFKILLFMVSMLFSSQRLTWAASVQVLLSSADKSHLLSEQPDLILEANDQSVNKDFVIQVNESVKYQQIDGFGAALLDGTALLVTEALDQKSLDDLWIELFDPNLGIGLSYLRLAVGASDLSPELYSYEDKKGVFSVDHDKLVAPVFPLVLKALKLNPRLKIMGSTWSPPAWMKTNKSMIQGSLAPEHQDDYAKYLVKTVKAWKAEGLPVHALTIQNEPKNGNFFTTSLFNLYPQDPVPPTAPVDQQTFLAKYLGPAFKQAGLDTKLLLWDHNYKEHGFNMIEHILTTLSDPIARQYSGGVAFHCYSDGDVSSVATIPQSYPGQDIYMTECSSGTWTSWEAQFNYDADQWIIEPLRAGAKIVLKWGLVLDDNHEPYLKGYKGSCSGCIGAVVIHKNQEGQYNGKWSFDRDYYILGQISKFVKPGAYRISSNDQKNGPIRNVAFENPDKSKVLYVHNTSSESQRFVVKTKIEMFKYEIPKQSVVTFKWP